MIFPWYEVNLSFPPRTVRPASPRAVLVLSHGVSEHILRYEPLAAYLTEWGFAVAGHDHLGHGLSVAAGAPRLYFGPRGSWDWAVQDLYARRAEPECFL